MAIQVKAHRRGKSIVKGYSRIENASGGGGTKKFGGHAFEIRTRAGKPQTVFRAGKYSEVAKKIKQLQNKVRGGYNVIKYLP